MTIALGWRHNLPVLRGLATNQPKWRCFITPMLFAPHTHSGAPKRQMPTAARLAAGILFFLVGWQAAQYTLLTFPEGTPATYFPLTIGLIGLWQGWMVAGSRAGQGIGLAFANGIRCSVQTAFFGILLFALRTMFMRSANLRYDSPGEATVATLELFMEYLFQTFQMPQAYLIWGTLLIGGALAGLVTEAVGRVWR